MAETLRLEINQPTMIALAYTKGRPVTSPMNGQKDIMFTTVDGYRIFLPESAAQQIYEAGIPARKPFQIIKRGPGNFAIVNQNGSYPAAASSRDAATGMPVTSVTSTQSSSPHHTNGTQNGNPPAPVTPTSSPEGRRLMSALGAAIDAVAESQEYAKRRGLGITFSEESVRCLAISVYIQNSREGR